jgi:hypothetical protein
LFTFTFPVNLDLLFNFIYSIWINFSES